VSVRWAHRRWRGALPMSSPMLRLRRLRCLGSLLAIGGTARWGLWNQDVQWIALTQDDLQWMWRQLNHCCDLGAPEDHLRRWIEIIKWHRGYWKRLVRWAAEHAIGVQAPEFTFQSTSEVSQQRIHCTILGRRFLQAIMLRSDGHSKIYFDDLRLDTN
jgi:hypothetical protein